ncbi:MAG: TetR/AcrR family transcriptional regulator [Oscillospiraceae bacterium]|nr:TetR/AcrR family transcriptional regulator [Oscillospiraceae bacterium]
MYKNCATNRSVARQRQLENALLEAILARGYANISIAELCDNALIPRKSFYRYFNGKEGALYALIDHTLSDFTSALFPGGELKAADTLTKFFSYWKTRSRFLDAIIKNDLSNLLLQRAIKLSLEEDVVAETLLKLHADVKKEYLVYFFVSGLLSLVFLWHNNGFKESPGEMAGTAMHLITRPIFSVMLP